MCGIQKSLDNTGKNEASFFILSLAKILYTCNYYN